MKQWVFIMWIISSFVEEGVELDNMTDYLIVVDQKIPADWLINITFLGKVETVLNIGLVSWALEQVMPFWVWIFFLYIKDNELIGTWY